MCVKMSVLGFLPGLSWVHDGQNHKKATARENLFSGFPTRSYPNQSAQLQSLARIVKFCLFQVLT